MAVPGSGEEEAAESGAAHDSAVRVPLRSCSHRRLLRRLQPRLPIFAALIARVRPPSRRRSAQSAWRAAPRPHRHAANGCAAMRRPRQLRSAQRRTAQAPDVRSVDHSRHVNVNGKYSVRGLAHRTRHSRRLRSRTNPVSSFSRRFVTSRRPRGGQHSCLPGFPLHAKKRTGRSACPPLSGRGRGA